MLASPRKLLRFESFTIDPPRGVVWRGDTELTLRRQSFEVLRYLADRVHQVVSSEELIGAIWTVRPANHHASVGQCIREIRQALGDDARWVIETISGRGYVFKAEVVTVDPSQPGVAALSPQALSNDEHAGLPPDALLPSTPPLSNVAKPATK